MTEHNSDKADKKPRPKYEPPRIVDMSGRTARGETEGLCINGSFPGRPGANCQAGLLPETGCLAGSGALLPVLCTNGSTAQN